MTTTANPTYCRRIYRKGDVLDRAALAELGVDADTATVRHAWSATGGTAVHLTLADGSTTVAAVPGKMPYIHLQGIGDLPGTPAGEIKPGDVLMWNYGYRCDVTAVRQVSARFVEIDQTGRREFAGQISTRRLRADRLVCKVTD